MVEVEPDSEEYFVVHRKTIWYNVTFLDDKVSHAWVPAPNVCSFLNRPKRPKLADEKKYGRWIESAEKKAREALSMSIKERLQKFSFAQRYNGKWPLAKDDPEEATEDLTGMLIKEGEDVESIKSFHSGDTDEIEMENLSDDASSVEVMSEEVDSKCSNTKTKQDYKSCPNENLKPTMPEEKIISLPPCEKSQIKPLQNSDAYEGTAKSEKFTEKQTNLKTVNSSRKPEINIRKKEKLSFEETLNSATSYLEKEIKTVKNLKDASIKKEGNKNLVVSKAILNTNINSEGTADTNDVKGNDEKNIMKHKKMRESTEEIKTATSKSSKQEITSSFKPPIKEGKTNKSIGVSNTKYTGISHLNAQNEEKKKNSETQNLDNKTAINTNKSNASKTSDNENINKVKMHKENFSKKTKNNIMQINKTVKKILQKNLEGSKAVKTDENKKSGIKKFKEKKKFKNQDYNLNMKKDIVNISTENEIRKMVKESRDVEPTNKPKKKSSEDTANCKNTNKIKSKINVMKRKISEEKHDQLKNDCSNKIESFKSTTKKSKHTKASSDTASLQNDKGENNYKKKKVLPDLSTNKAQLMENKHKDEKLSLRVNLEASDPEHYGSEDSDSFEVYY